MPFVVILNVSEYFLARVALALFLPAGRAPDAAQYLFSATAAAYHLTSWCLNKRKRIENRKAGNESLHDISPPGKSHLSRRCRTAHTFSSRKQRPGKPPDSNAISILESWQRWGHADACIITFINRSSLVAASELSENLPFALRNLIAKSGYWPGAWEPVENRN